MRTRTREMYVGAPTTFFLACFGILFIIALPLAAFLPPDGVGKEVPGHLSEDWPAAAARMIDSDTTVDVQSPPVDCEKCVHGLERISSTFYKGVHHTHNDSRQAVITIFEMTAVSPSTLPPEIVAPQVPHPEGGDCCVILLDGLRLRSDTAVFINPANGQGVPPSFTLGGFLSANDQVRSALGEAKTFIKAFHLVNEVMTTDDNGRNEVFFAELINIPGSQNIVAIAMAYLICTDFNDVTNQCVGDLSVGTHKIVFNVKDFTFGDATQNGQVIDLWAITAHEHLHPQGIGDFRGGDCQEATMFATIGTGETKKRSFHSSDIQCLQSLYEAPISSSDALLLTVSGTLSVSLCLFLS